MIGEGIEEIMSMRRGKHLQIQGPYPQLIQNSVPLVVACTKFDVLVLIEDRHPLDHESAIAKASARLRYKPSYPSPFDHDLANIPAKIVQGSLISSVKWLLSLEKFVCLQ